ncbi:MAG: hypothetical protein ACRENX_12910 [Candidatus Dormibacteria bacterium]
MPGFPTIDPNNGFTTQALGHLAAMDWLHGQVPWWNPYEGVGTPLAGEMASASLLPLVLLETLSNGVLFFHMTLELLTGAATYLFVRRLGVGTIPALVAGVAFALNGTFSWLGAAMVNPVAFLPLLLLGTELARSAAQRNRRGGWILVGLAIALAIYSGFPETTAIDSLFCGFWVLLRLHDLTRPQGWKFLRKGLFGLLLGVALAAPLIVAFLDYVAHGDIGGHGPGFSGIHLPHSAISMVVMPYVFGPIFGYYRNDPTGTIGAIWSNVGGYTTATVAGLASLAVIGAVVGRRDRWLRLGLLIWIILALSLTFGVPLLRDVLELIPGISHTAFFRYAPPSWELASLVLAAFGIEDVVRVRVTKPAIWTSATAALLLLTVSSGVAFRLIRLLQGAEAIRWFATGSLVWALAMVAAVILIAQWVYVGGETRGRRAGLLLAALVAIDVLSMFLVPQFSAPPSASVDLGPVEYLQGNLGDYRFFTLGPLQPDYGSYFGLADVNTADLPVPSTWAEYVGSDLAPNTNPITFSGTEINNPHGPSPWQQFTTYFRNYESIGVKYVVLSTPAMPTVIPSRLGLRKVYSDRVATIFRLPHPSRLFQAQSDHCRLRPVTLTSVVVTCHSAANLLYREQYLPGWSATVRGMSVAVHPSGPLFQEVRVPGGRTVVDFRYQPEYLDWALVIGGVAIVVLLVSLGFALRRGRRPGDVAGD